jgi:hypothetical protein
MNTVIYTQELEKGYRKMIEYFNELNMIYALPAGR